MEYKFESEQFSISEDGIHLLRNRYEYKSYPFKEVNKLIVENGKLINNWFVVLFLGIGFIGFSIYYAFNIYMALNSDEVFTFYVEELVVPVIPFLLGLYCVYSSLKTGPIIKFEFSDGKNKRFSLNKAKKENQLDDFLYLLKDTAGLDSKSQVNL